MTRRSLQRCLWLVAAIVAGAMSANASATEFQVASAADIATTMAKAQPGDALIMRNGTWPDQDVVFQGEGTAEKPITLRAETSGSVILNGNSRLRIGGSHLVVEGLWFKDGSPTADTIDFRQSSKLLAENCVLRNVAITSFGSPENLVENRWVSIYGARNVVESCYFAGKRNRGATLVVWVDPARLGEHQIRGNHFGPRPALGKNGGETIRIGDSETSMSNARTLVEGNLFDRCNGEIEIVSNKSCENIYRGNTFRACEGALTFRHGQRGLAENNFFLGENQPKTGGVRLIDADHRVVNNYFADLTGDGARSALSMMNGRVNSPSNGYFPVRNAVVAFNTFVDCRHTFVIGRPDGRETLAPERCTIANNIVRTKSGPITELVTAPLEFSWRENFFFGADSGVSANGIIVADPQLQLDADQLWRPLAESPARGSGFGADPSRRASKVARPLHPADVGPTWLKPAERSAVR